MDEGSAPRWLDARTVPTSRRADRTADIDADASRTALSGHIFRDDSTAADKRAAAAARLTELCPAPMRMLAQPYIQSAVNNASDDEIAALLIDIDQVVSLAENGNLDAISAIARKYGASDAQIATFLPGASATSESDAMRQFADFLPTR